MSLKDRGWIDVQKRTWTKWTNMQLEKAKKGYAIENVLTDFSDGIMLMELLKIISGGKLPDGTPWNFKYNRKPKMKIQRNENCNKALAFLKAAKIKLVGIGSSDIESGNEKLILGLLWTIILRFEVNIEIEGMSGKAGLLLWAKRCCQPEGVKVANFTTSWKDGRAFAALVRHHRRDLVPSMEDYPEDDAEGNLTKIFKVIEEDLGIPQLIEVQDIIGSKRPDEKSIVTYVAQLFGVFAGSMQMEKHQKAVERAIMIARNHAKWIDD